MKKDDKPLLTIHGEIELEVRDRNGKLIHKHREPAKSFTANFAHWLRAFFANSEAGYITDEPVVDTGGTSKQIFDSQARFSCEFGAVRALAGDDKSGLVIGYGTVEKTPDDYKLASQYTEGTSEFQFAHGAVTVENVTKTTTQSQFKAVRTFTNNYTASQTVYEVGLYMRLRDSTGTIIYICIARDVLGKPVSVPSGSTLTVRYILTFTV